MKGGARRVPEPDALRRDRPDDIAGWVELPRAGRDGPVPEWPLSDPLPRELELWEREWRRPQALMWEKADQEVEVAAYVRALAEAEKHGASVASRTLVKQLMEALGISIPGLRQARWKIVDEVSAAQSGPRGTRKTGGSARDRLKVVVDGESA